MGHAQGQQAGDRIEPSQQVVIVRPHDPDPQAVTQTALQHGLDRLVAVQAEVGGQGFGGHVEAVDVVVLVVEEVAHLLVGQQRAGRAALVQRHGLLGGLQPLVQPAIGVVQGQIGLGEIGRIGHRRLQLRQAGDLAILERIGRGLAQVGDHPLVVGGVQRGGVDLEHPHHVDQHPGRHRSLIGLDLRQVAGRDAQAGGAHLQLPSLGLAQKTDLGADEQLVAHVSQLCGFTNLEPTIIP